MKNKNETGYAFGIRLMAKLFLAIISMFFLFFVLLLQDEKQYEIIFIGINISSMFFN